MYKYISIILFILAVILAVVETTLPVQDGDLWWQMAYGRQMIEKGTLIPDHEAFTWTPADNDTIYCAWLGEIVLYLLYRLGGLTSLFILRYSIFAVLLFLLYRMSFFYKRQWDSMTGLVAIIFLVLGVSAGSYLKPEIFSFFFTGIYGYIWWRIKSKSDDSPSLLYLFPAIMLVWVNTHGAFLFGGLYFGLLMTGELINRKINFSSLRTDRYIRHMLIVSFLMLLSLFITPYGIRYPVNLVQNVFTQSEAELRTVVAYLSPFGNIPAMLIYTFVIFLGGSAIYRQYREHCLDWSFILPLFVFSLLFFKFVRTTYFLAPVFAFGYTASFRFVEQTGMSAKSKNLYRALVILMVSFSLALNSFFSTLFFPAWNIWPGLGNGYFNPVEETDFIKRNYKDTKIGNLYNCGGYMLWALGPETKIMIDPRYFPFRKWYREYHDFVSGKNVKFFLSKFDSDVFCIQYQDRSLSHYFLKSGLWHPVFYGTGGIVFIKKDIIKNNLRTYRGEGIGSIKNIEYAIQVFEFALRIEDREGAAIIYEGIRRNFTSRFHREFIENIDNFYAGIKAYFSHNYKDAVGHLEACTGKMIRNDDILWACYHLAAVDFWTEGDTVRAYQHIKKAVAMKKDLFALYNLGVIEWWVSREAYEKKDMPDYALASVVDYSSWKTTERWKQNLSAFLKGTESAPGADQVRSIARNIIEGKYTTYPLLIYPPEPEKQL